MLAVNFVHLFSERFVLVVALLCGESAILRVRELCLAVPEPDGSEHPVAHDFVEALRPRWQLLQIVIVERAHRRVVHYLPVRLVENDIDRIRPAAVGQLLTSEDDSVAVEVRFEHFLALIYSLVRQFGGNKRAGILAESFLHSRGVPPQIKLAGDLSQTTRSRGMAVVGDGHRSAG